MKLTDLPGVQLPTTCLVDRRVLVSMLGRLGRYADELGEERQAWYYRLANEVEAGERETIRGEEVEGEGEPWMGH